MIETEELAAFAKYMDRQGIHDNALRLRLAKEFSAGLTHHREGVKRAKALGAIDYRKRPDGVWEMPRDR